MIRYSIIIPHHNIPDLLFRCILSIPDLEDIQVIIVDDNSNDESTFWEAILTANHKNVEAYVTKEGRGAGYARNVGLKYAKGRWLVFADADDFFLAGFMCILDQCYEMKEDIAYFNIKSCLSEDLSTSSNRTKDFMFQKFDKEREEALFRFGYTEPWGKLIRREMVEANCIRFDETQVANDYLFSVKIGYFAKSIKVINLPIYMYTLRCGSLASQDKSVHLNKLLSRLDAYIHVQAFMKSKGFYSTPALTSHILVPLFKNYNSVYRHYIGILYHNHLSICELFCNTLFHYFNKLIGKEMYYGDVYNIKWKHL